MTPEEAKKRDYALYYYDYTPLLDHSEHSAAAAKVDCNLLTKVASAIDYVMSQVSMATDHPAWEGMNTDIKEMLPYDCKLLVIAFKELEASLTLAGKR